MKILATKSLYNKLVDLNLVIDEKYNFSIIDNILAKSSCKKYILLKSNNDKLQTIQENNALAVYEINNKEDLNKIPFKQYFYLIKIVEIIHKYCDCIILYGSIANKTFNNLSDVDLFVTSTYSVEYLKKHIQSHFKFDFIDVLDNKLTIRKSDVLIELVAVKQIEDNLFYYVNSIIDNEEKTIIKGDSETLKKLTDFNTDFKENNDIDTERIFKRLFYFVLSLQSLIQKKDDYRYFFHTNIILHEFTKLNAIYNDNKQHNYLPKQATEICDLFNHKELIYDFNKNKLEHYKKIIEITKKFLKLFNFNKKYDNYLNSWEKMMVKINGKGEENYARNKFGKRDAHC